MIKIFCSLLLAVSFLFVFSGCKKTIDAEGAETLAPGQGELKSSITTAAGKINFEAKGAECRVIKSSASGFTAHLIVGTTKTNPALKLGITLMDIKAPGTYTNSKNVELSIGLDAANANNANVFSSELDVMVNITRITDKIIEGTFSGKIINIDGTHTGLVNNGSFRARLN